MNFLTDNIIGNKVLLENRNGVYIKDKQHGHYVATGAKCIKNCNTKLIVAPTTFHPKHKKENPIMVCGDMGIHGFWFKDLVKGNQPESFLLD